MRLAPILPTHPLASLRIDVTAASRLGNVRQRGAVPSREWQELRGGVVSGVFNLESSGVRASDWRPRQIVPDAGSSGSEVPAEWCPRP